MQVGPNKPMVKAPVTDRLKLKHDTLLSIFAFNSNLRRYKKFCISVHYRNCAPQVGR